MFSANVGSRKSRIGRKMDQSPDRRRFKGFSLLEIILATALLLGCAVALAELANIGREHVRSAEQWSAAQLVCQSKLNEMLCGAAPIATIEDQPLDDLPGWTLSVETRPLERPDLVALRVTVAEEKNDRRDRRRKQFSLVRWIRNPTGKEASGGGSSAEPTFEPFSDEGQQP